MWLTIAIFVVVTLTGCRRGLAPDTNPAPPQSGATISGTVRGPEGSTHVDGRIVYVVNIDTFERQRVVTNQGGGFSVKVKPGKYRVELPLRQGEALVRQPETIDLVDRDGGADADFVLGNVRVSRPRTPNYRANDGLGSPIA